MSKIASTNVSTISFLPKHIADSLTAAATQSEHEQERSTRRTAHTYHLTMDGKFLNNTYAMARSQARSLAAQQRSCNIHANVFAWA